MQIEASVDDRFESDSHILMDFNFNAVEDTFSDAINMVTTHLADQQPAESDFYTTLHYILADVLHDARRVDALSKFSSTSMCKDYNIGKIASVMTKRFILLQ